MTSNKNKEFIIKYLSKSISNAELDLISKELNKQENEKVFNDFIKINYAIDFSMSEYNSEKAKELLFKKIKEEKYKTYKRKFKSVFKYAAIFFVLISLFYLVNKEQSSVFNKTQQESSKIDDTNIILELDDGTKKVISSNGVEKIVNDKGNVVGVKKENRLVYQNKDNIKDLVYNTLTIPYGKRFEIVLSDGTKVFLNSGSSLKYPVNFIGGKNRKVFLKGEGYFDVSEDKLHPFIVAVDEIDVKVLGTKFNVSYYEEDDNVNTVLAEGAVALYQKDTKSQIQELQPGYKATWDKKEQKMSIAEVDVEIYTSWRSGAILYKNKSFNAILKSLERTFNVVIENQYDFLGEQIYTASFHDGENIQKILEYFNEDTEFDFDFKNNKIIITKPTK